MQVYGAEKVWRQLAREGTAAARCTVERLGETLNALLKRLDRAIARYYQDGETTDEINAP